MSASDPLIGLIYDAALDPCGGEAVARALADHLGGMSAMITDVDALGDAQAVQWGHDVTLTGAYAARYRQLDVWVAASPRCAPRVATAVDRLVSYDHLARTEFYNDFLRVHGGMAHCLGVWSPVDAGIGIVSVQRNRAQGAFDREDEARLDRLAPHLVRAAQMRARLGRARARIATLDGVFDRSPDAMLVLRPDGRLVHLNEAARRLVESGVVTLSAERPLDRCGPGDHALVGAVHRVRSTPVTPVHFVLGDGSYLGAADRIETGQILITIIDVAERRARQVEVAVARFKFSPAEAALLSALLAGQTPRDFALARDIRISTVRTQLSGLLAKAGVDRQTSLVSLVSALPTI